jgi:acetyltransferase-like isoleucine patch superfamily enzyme
MNVQKLLTVARRRYLSQRLGGIVFLRGIDVGTTPMVWGKPMIEASNLCIGDEFLLHSKLRTTRIAGKGAIRIGDRVFINHGSTITARQSVAIGNDVALAEDVFVLDSSGHGIEGGAVEAKPVVIENGAWVGMRSIILPGVTVGHRSIIAAGSVVTKDVPSESVVAGNPARHVRDLVYPEGVDRGLRSPMGKTRHQGC